MRATLIHNPNAGGANALSSNDLLLTLKNAGYEAWYSPTETPEELDQVLAQPTDLVVAAGGDGTVRAVAERLAGQGTPLAVVPMGTANNVAGALGIFGQPPLKILGGLAEPRKRPMDAGRVRAPWGEDFFLEAAGWGLFASTLHVYDPEGEKSVLRGIQAGLRTVTDFQAKQLRMWCDGEEVNEPLLLLEAMNTTALSHRVRLAPQADPADRLLDVVTVADTARVNVLSYITGLLGERLEELPNVSIRRCKQVRLEWDGSPFHLDAEVHNQDEPGEIEVEVWPGALEIWLPALEETQPAPGGSGVRVPGAV